MIELFTSAGRLIPGFISATSFDHLVGAGKNRDRECYTESLCGPEINDQLDFNGLLDRQFLGLLALENAADVDACQAISVPDAGTVAHETTRNGEVAKRVNGRQYVACRQAGELFIPAGK